jgi:hypothetical protein
MTPNTTVKKIIQINKSLANFWSSPHGWAPHDAANLLSSSMLHWQTELSEALEYWLSKYKLSEGELILAWSNLGSLIEGSLKLFLCVYLHSYHADDNANKLTKKGKIKLPDEATLEWLKQYYVKKNLFPEFFPLIEKVQRNRNAIHSFKKNTIEGISEFKNALSSYLELLNEIKLRLPYPDDFY